MEQQGRVLVACSSRVERERVAARLDGSGLECRCVESAGQALSLLDAERFDAVLISPEPNSMALAEKLSASACVVLVADRPSVDDALDALRRGVADIVTRDMPAREFVSRVSGCAAKGRKAHAREDRVERLRKMCRRLSAAKQDAARQVGTLCTDLVNAYQELSSQMSQVSIASEYGALVRHELDLEGLLRTTLEFVLAKAGPTNAAIFLPSPGGDYSLGAYVNYDGAKEGGEVLLEHLAGVAAPRAQDEPAPVILDGDESIRAYLGEGGAWLGSGGSGQGRQAVLLSCRHDDECLAVMVLFRDRTPGFSPDAVTMLAQVAELFASNLARVIRIHHRHLPKDKWGAIGEGDDADLAA